MSFIRNKTEEKTCYQSGSHITDSVDNQVDVALVYRLDESLPERINEYKQKGYVIHMMTGISWGHYCDYLDGEFDGRSHWDEVQTDRFGNQILHSVRVPYMVPTIAFADYMTAQLKKVVDLGVEAIHVEEPEFWDRAGYSEAFKREYEIYYRAKWIAPHESVDARFKCAKLKAYLYARTIERLSASLKEYAKIKYDKDLRFYVPTHSLLNYTQWKIVSPEGKLADIPGVDGCIAQVWTGTSREKNWYDGILKERTFETAFLEYGVMQELVKGTGRKMWFLHDPIEDCPEFDWDDYKQNYLKTVAASLMHTKVDSYEVCPWPTRVFHEKYPRNSENGEPISQEYQTILNNTFNTLGNMKVAKGNDIRVGVLMADSQLCQREYPDSEFSTAAKEEVGTVLLESKELWDDFRNKLFKNPDENRELMLKFMASKTFPGFYSLALPLLKYGVPVCPVLLDNTRRYPGYLDDYDVLLMSYEYMKPDYPDVDVAISDWVRRGGTLIYIGNGFDPYNNINSWWTGKYNNPAEHLFEMLSVNNPEDKLISECGKGTVGIWNTNPSMILFNKEGSDSMRAFVKDVLDKAGRSIEYRNYIKVSRNEYVVAAVLDESLSDEPLEIEGLFADMFTPSFDIVTKKTVYPGENCLLCDLDKIDDGKQIIGTSVRILSMESSENSLIIKAHGAECKANIRVKTPYRPSMITVCNNKIDYTYDDISKTTLISFCNKAEDIILEVKA